MLVIDSREHELLARLVIDPFNKEPGDDFLVDTLPAGDIAIRIGDYDLFGWERKTFRDFISSWSSKMGRAGDDDAAKGDRLSSQLHDTYKTYQFPGLIIELENKESQYGISILDTRAEEYLRTMGWGLNIIQFNFLDETIDYILKMDKKVKSGWLPSMTKHIATRDHSLKDIANVCSVLNIGIKEKKGAKLDEKYGSLPRFIEEVRLNPDGLLEIDGIGKTIVKKLREKFAGE